jgi:hypothetical protein
MGVMMISSKSCCMPNTPDGGIDRNVKSFIGSVELPEVRLGENTCRKANWFFKLTPKVPCMVRPITAKFRPYPFKRKRAELDSAIQLRPLKKSSLTPFTVPIKVACRHI